MKYLVRRVEGWDEAAMKNRIIGFNVDNVDNVEFSETTRGVYLFREDGNLVAAYGDYESVELVEE